MSDPGYIKYQTFIEGRREANPQIKKEEQLRAAQALWKSVRYEKNPFQFWQEVRIQAVKMSKI